MCNWKRLNYTKLMFLLKMLSVLEKKLCVELSSTLSTLGCNIGDLSLNQVMGDLGVFLLMTTGKTSKASMYMLTTKILTWF